MNNLDSETIAMLERERDAFRSAMLALLGADDYPTAYECEHGTPLGQRCHNRKCHLNPVRAAIKMLPR